MISIDQTDEREFQEKANMREIETRNQGILLYLRVTSSQSVHLKITISYEDLVTAGVNAILFSTCSIPQDLFA